MHLFEYLWRCTTKFKYSYTYVGIPYDFFPSLRESHDIFIPMATPQILWDFHDPHPRSAL